MDLPRWRAASSVVHCQDNQHGVSLSHLRVRSVTSHLAPGELPACRTAVRRRASQARYPAATSSHTATATQSTPRLTGSMKLRLTALPSLSVATLYMPIGKTRAHSVGS